jgi:hypothetical protein
MANPLGMDKYHQIMLQQESLLHKNGYAQLVESTPFLAYLEHQLDAAMYMAHKQNRSQTFTQLAHADHENFGKLFLKFNYQYDPAQTDLQINSIEAFLGNTARRFIPLVKDHLPPPDAIAHFLVNAKRLKASKWAKTYKAMPMDLQPGTHRKRRPM